MKKMQATITDALLFLGIVTVLAGLIYLFTLVYGINAYRRFISMYSKLYLSSSLKTLMYVSVPRDKDENIENTKIRDYLFTIIKEDYYDDSNIGENTKILFAKEFIKINKRTFSKFDYLFFIYVKERGVYTFPLVFLKTTNEIENAGEKDYNTIYLFCHPVQYSAISNLTVALGVVASIDGLIWMAKKTPSGDRYYNASIGVVMWNSTPLYEDSSPKDVVEDLNCTERYVVETNSLVSFP